jgi:hypothetical protein
MSTFTSPRTPELPNSFGKLSTSPEVSNYPIDEENLLL